MAASRVLLVEDSPGDASLVRAALGAASGNVPDITWVERLGDAVAALRAAAYDCVLLDLGLPDGDGLDVLDAVLSACPGVAAVVLTGRSDRDLGVAAVHHGAQDYLLKSELTAPSLERAIRYAVERATARAELARREAEQRALVESLGEGVIVHDARGVVAEVNAAAARILGRSAAELRGSASLGEAWGAVTADGLPFPADQHPALVALRTGAPVETVVIGVDADGARRWIEVNAAPLVASGAAAPHAAVASFRDVTARREAEAEVRVQAALLDAAGNAIVVTAPDGTIRYWNSGAEATYGWTAAEVVGRNADDVPAFRGLRARSHTIAAALASGEVWTGDVDATRRDGAEIRTLVTQTPLLDDAGVLVEVISVATDVTARRRAEDAARRLSAIVDSSDDAIVGRALDGTVVSWNPAAERLTGYPAAAAIGRHATFIATAVDRAGVDDTLARIARGEAVRPYETVVVRSDGAHVEVSLTISPIRDEDGNVIGSSAIAKDITEQVRLRRAAEEDRRRLAEAQAVAGLGSFEHVPAERRVYFSDELCRIFGIPGGGPIPEAEVYARVHPDDFAAFDAARRKATGSGRPVDVAYRVVRPDGEVRHVTARVRAHRDDGAALRLVGTVLDVTDRERAAGERRAAERRFELGFERAAAGTAITDLAGRFLRVNAALCRLLGRQEDELIGRHPDDFLHPDCAGAVTPFADLADGVARTGAEVRFSGAGGIRVDTLVDVAIVTGAGDEPEYGFVQILDITRRKQAERALAHQALHDTLTGLPNRALLLDRLDHALAQRDRRRGHVAVLLVDLDQFKLVNDGMGHSAGDALLVDVAARLRIAVRPGDTVCRLGGDEFVICCEDVHGEEEALEIGQRVCEAFAAPFSIERRELFATASVGITLSAASSTASALLRDADAAMYRAKERGRARVEMFDEVLRLRASSRLATATALRRALPNNEFAVHYQPIVALADERLVGFEALVRWNDPARGLVAPDEFVALAEETGLIVPLGEEVLRQATAQLATWTAAHRGAADLTIAVNVSARQMVDPNLVPTVDALLRQSGVAPHRLHLEITETVLMDDVDDSIEVLCALAKLGVTLQIDDFGTGYSSLSYLKRLPVDTLKVDRSFVSGLAQDADDLSIVTAIAALGRALGLRLHAEGVENAEQAAAVAALGCDVAQGYHWSRPLTAKAAGRWVRRAALTSLSSVPAPRAPWLAVSG